MILLRGGKFAASGCVPSAHSETMAPVSAIPVKELRIFRRIDHIESAAQNRYGWAACQQGALVGRRVDPAGQTADDGQPLTGQIATEAFGCKFTVGACVTRAHNRQAGLIGNQFPLDVEQRRSVMGMPKQRRIVGIFRGQDADAEASGRCYLAIDVTPRCKGGDALRCGRADPLCGCQIRRVLPENLTGAAETTGQPFVGHIADAFDGFEGQCLSDVFKVHIAALLRTFRE